MFDIAADIADFGKFRGFDLEKRRSGQFGEPSGDFGFAATGGPDHQDVFRQDLFAHCAFEFQPAPTVAQRNRHGAFGVFLTDDEAIQFGNNFAGRKIGHGAQPAISSDSMVKE